MEINVSKIVFKQDLDSPRYDVFFDVVHTVVEKLHNRSFIGTAYSILLPENPTENDIIEAALESTLPLMDKWIEQLEVPDPQEIPVISPNVLNDKIKKVRDKIKNKS